MNVTSAPAWLPVARARLGSWRLALERTPYAPEAVAALYDREAPTWDRLIGLSGTPASYRDLFRGLRVHGDLPTLDAATRVLDAGAGTGAFASALLDALDPDPRPRVDLVDLSPAMLERASAALAARGVVAEKCRADLRALPYAAGTFDLALSAHALEHLPDPVGGLRELVRVVRPGGTVVVAVSRPGVGALYVPVRWRVRTVSPGQIVAALREAGAETVRAVPLGGRLGVLSVAAVGRRPRHG